MGGAEAKIKLFQAYRIEGNDACGNMISNILPVDPICPRPSDPGEGSKGQNSTFSEHGHVAYLILGNDECKHIFCPYSVIHTLGSEVKTFFFSERSHVA